MQERLLGSKLLTSAIIWLWYLQCINRTLAQVNHFGAMSYYSLKHCKQYPAGLHKRHSEAVNFSTQALISRHKFAVLAVVHKTNNQAAVSCTTAAAPTFCALHAYAHLYCPLSPSPQLANFCFVCTCTSSAKYVAVCLKCMQSVSSGHNFKFYTYQAVFCTI